jgi:hypothetical protein
VSAAQWVGAGIAAWIGVAVAVALRLSAFLDACDPGEDAPDGTAGDLLAGLTCDVLTQPEVDALFVRLVAPVEAEIDGRLR